MKATIKYVCYSLMLSLVVFGCGKKDDGGGGGGTPYNAYANYCANQPGTVPTTQCGCVPQNGCPAGQGMCNGQCVAQGIPNNGWNNGQSCQAGYLYTTQCGCAPQNGCSAGMAMCNGQCVSGSTGGGGSCLPGMPGCPTNCLPGQPGCSTGGGGNAQQYAQYICSMYGLQAFQTPWCQTGYACNLGYTYGCVYF